MAKVSTKTIARMAAVQALYACEINNRTGAPEEVASEILNNYSADDFKNIFQIPKNIDFKIHTNYMKELVSYAINNIKEIDEIITLHLAPGWKYEAMHIALISILRVAIAELLYFKEVPYKVIINEFTTIATEIVKDSEVPFVNSLLDHVRIKYRTADD